MAGIQLDAWYLSMPPITRAFMTACVATTVFEFLGVVSIMDLYLNFSLVTERTELWRLLTTFVYMGELGLPFILKMYFAIRYSRLLEENQFRGRAADFFMLYFFSAVSLLGISAFFHYYRIAAWKPPPFLGPVLSNAILYVWAKRSPYIRMSFMGLFNFPATYLPWVILGLEFLMSSGSIVFEVLGILVGHLFNFLTDVYPRTRGIHLLPTPTVLKVLFGQVDRLVPDAQPQNAPNEPRNPADDVPPMRM